MACIIDMRLIFVYNVVNTQGPCVEISTPQTGGRYSQVCKISGESRKRLTVPKATCRLWVAFCFAMCYNGSRIWKCSSCGHYGEGACLARHAILLYNDGTHRICSPRKGSRLRLWAFSIAVIVQRNHASFFSLIRFWANIKSTMAFASGGKLW